MFDEANSLCATSNLPLSVRVATKGLLSAKVPSAEAMLGCIYERQQKTETLKRFSKQCCSCHRIAQFLLTKPPESLPGSSKRAKFPLLLALTSTTRSSRTKALWHPLRRNISPTASFSPVQLLSLQITLNSHSYSEQTAAFPLPHIFKRFYYYFCQQA